MDTYEQKYKEALGWMKSLYGGLHGKTKEEAEKYFPEIAVSEDELIRKEIIAFLKENLETGSAEETWSLSGLERWISWLEKQGKPKWTDEDEERLQSCIIALQGKGLMGGVDTMDSKWLKSLKQRMEE